MNKTNNFNEFILYMRYSDKASADPEIIPNLFAAYYDQFYCGNNLPNKVADYPYRIDYCDIFSNISLSKMETDCVI